MKRYNHHGMVVSNEHPQGQWCRWEDVKKLYHIAQNLACMAYVVDQTPRLDPELAQDVANALRRWEEYDV